MTCSMWTKVKLKDISTDGKGFYGIGASAVDFDENLYTYLRITDISDDGRINKEELMSVNDPEAKKYFLKENDIVFARTGNSTGRSYFYDKKDGDLVFAGFLIRFNLDPLKVNPKYIKMYTLTQTYKNWINSFSTGSTRRNINAKMFGEMEIDLPSREYQDFVVKLIEPLNSKIQVNEEMNKTLHEMAKVFFKRWFVDYEFPKEDGSSYKTYGGKFEDSELGSIPKGWEVKTIGQICDITSSKRVFLKDYVPQGIPFYRSKEIIEKNKGKNISTELYIPEELYENIKEKFGVPIQGDILLTSVGTLGVPYLVGKEKFYFKDGNLTWFKNFKTDGINLYLYYWLLSKNGTNSIDSITIGSTQKALTINALKNIKILVPNDNMLTMFYHLFVSINSQVEENIKQNSHLYEIRDTLLPRLISGEIIITDAEMEVEECLQKSN
jgi:type I restriction enzyme, S subunit